MAIDKNCRLCHQEGTLEPLVDYGYRPITKRLLNSTDDAGEYLHHIVLDLCNHCGFVQISDVIPEKELYSNYELPSSWKSQPHLEDEVKCMLEMKVISPDSFVVEIGCNDGIAFKVLQRNNITRTLGIEPSQDVAKLASDNGFSVINDYFTKQLAAQIKVERGQADFLFSRQVLEHVSYLDSFMDGVRELLKDDGHLMIEVPDFSVPLAFGDPSAIWEEHVNHFTEQTLRLLLRKFGFEIYEVKRYDFSGGALCVFARKGPKPEAIDLAVSPEVIADMRIFADRVEAYKSSILDALESELKNGGKIAVYGAGNRTVILLNYLLKDYVSFVVDDQKEKQNRYLPLSRHQILPSSALVSKGVTLCLLAVNAENEDKAIKNNQAYLEGGGRFISILSPSKHMLGKGGGDGNLAVQ